MKNNDVEDLLQYHSPYLRKRTARFVTNEVLKGRFACAHLFDQLVSADSEQPVPLEPLDQVVLEKKIRAWLDRPVLPALWQRSIGQYSPIEGEDNLDDKSDFGNGTEGEPRLRPLYQGMMQLLSEPGTYSSKLAQAPSDRANLREHVELWCRGEESSVKAFFYKRSYQHFWDMCLELDPSARSKTFAENKVRLLEAIRTLEARREARQEDGQHGHKSSDLSNSELANDLVEMIWSGELKLTLDIQDEVNQLQPSYQAGTLNRGEEEAMTDRLVTRLLEYLYLIKGEYLFDWQEEPNLAMDDANLIKGECLFDGQEEPNLAVDDANLARMSQFRLLEQLVATLSQMEQKVAYFMLPQLQPDHPATRYLNDQSFYQDNGLTSGQLATLKKQVKAKLAAQVRALDPDLISQEEK